MSGKPLPSSRTRAVLCSRMSGNWRLQCVDRALAPRYRATLLLPRPDGRGFLVFHMLLGKVIRSGMQSRGRRWCCDEGLRVRLRRSSLCDQALHAGLVVGLQRMTGRCLLCIEGDLSLCDSSVSLCPHFCNACLAFLQLELLGCHLCLHLLYRIWLCRRDLIWRCQYSSH